MSYPMLKCMLSLAFAVTSSATYAQATDDAWHYTAGVAALSGPEYPGADHRRNEVVPVFEADRGYVFIGALPIHDLVIGGGGDVLRNENWHIGLGIGGQFVKPREESDSSKLRGMGDIDESAIGAAYANYHGEHVLFQLSVTTDLGSSKQGTRANLDLMGTLQLTGRVNLAAGPGLTWANRQDMQTFFGVSQQQSASSGLDPFAPSQGISTKRFSLAIDYKPSQHWDISAKYVAARLNGEAANSPVTSSASQNGVYAIAMYHF